MQKSKVVQQISIALQANVPIMLWGEPGIGKSSIVRYIADKLGWPCYTIIASIHDPTDFSGLPYIDKDKNMTCHALPHYLIELNNQENAILFLDEVNCAPLSVQAALFRLVLEKAIDNYKLHDGVRIIAASNPTEYNEASYEFSTPLINRFVHLQFKIEDDLWLDGLRLGQFHDYYIPILPQDWKNKLPEASAIVASFLDKHRALIQNIPNERSKREYGFPTMRSWHMFVIPLLAACRSINMDESITLDLIAGAIGTNAAIEFMTYLKNLDIPSIDYVLQNYNNMDWNKIRRDVAYVICTNLVTYVKDHEDDFGIVLNVFGKLGQTNLVDVAMPYVRELAKFYKHIYITKGKKLQFDKKALERYSGIDEIVKEVEGK